MSESSYTAKYWHRTADNKISCDLCSRGCRLGDGQRGACYIRQRAGDSLILTAFGRAIGLCVDPIEKKPLAHFYPGSGVLSFGTAGCNLSCKFCQNWSMSASKDAEVHSEAAAPSAIARAAGQIGCRSVAFTYNDPVPFVEYAIETAKECHQLGIKTVAVTAGDISPEPRRDLFAHVDAANIDLKSFSERFYQSLCSSHLQPVLDTLSYVYHETNTWLEITTLLIPGENDSDEELEMLTGWIADELGPDVPIHFSAYHPAYRFTSAPTTPAETLFRACDIARKQGLYYPLAGNINDREHATTYCHQCRTSLIERDWYHLVNWNLSPNGVCPNCGAVCAGHFDERPGDWGNRRLPVRLS